MRVGVLIVLLTATLVLSGSLGTDVSTAVEMTSGVSIPDPAPSMPDIFFPPAPMTPDPSPPTIYYPFPFPQPMNLPDDPGTCDFDVDVTLKQYSYDSAVVIPIPFPVPPIPVNVPLPVTVTFTTGQTNSVTLQNDNCNGDWVCAVPVYSYTPLPQNPVNLQILQQQNVSFNQTTPCDLIPGAYGLA
jgi:hypothetical protein